MNFKLRENLEPIDNTFALENYEYATKEMGIQKIQDIYSMLGPFDFNQYVPGKKDDAASSDEEKDFDPEAAVDMDYNWSKRKSGAQYRGEIRTYNKRPEGKGFKVYGSSVYEGYF
jgi:hypothetical protein